MTTFKAHGSQQYMLEHGRPHDLAVELLNPPADTSSDALQTVFGFFSGGVRQCSIASLTNALLQAVLNQTGYFIGSYMLRPEIGAGGNRFDISKLETRYNVPLAYILAGLGFFLVSYWTVFLRCDRLLHYSTLTFTVECARQRTTTC